MLISGGRYKMYEATDLSLDRVLMDGIRDMVFIIRVGEDSDFYYDFLNRAAMEGTGLTQHVLGKSIREVYPIEAAHFLFTQYQKVVSSHESITYEDSYESPLGEIYYSETKLTPLVDEYKRCTQIVAVVHDITEKKYTELEIKESQERLKESRQRYRSLFDYNSDAILSFDLDGNVLSGNAAVEHITGYILQECIGSSFFSLIVPEHVNPTKKYFQQASGGTVESFRMAMLNKTGKRIELLVMFSPIIIKEEIVGIYGILKDVTENVKILNKFKESENRFRIIAEHAHDLITLLDDKGKIIYASPSYRDIVGFDYKEYVGKFFFHNVHMDDINRLEKAFSMSMENGQTCELQFKQKHRTEGWIWSELHGTPVFDDLGEFSHIVVVSRDITLRKEYESRLEHFAYHDSLTGLPNRRLFIKRLTHALKDFEEKRDGLAVIMMDIDHFKTINDQMGHDIGDEVIEEFGKRVSQNVRGNDLVARLGGDEFIILLPSIESVDHAITIAEKIKKAMQEPWCIKDDVLEVTTSMGIAMAPFQDVTVSSMLKSADEALYGAKSAGRNTYKTRDSLGCHRP